MDDDSLSASTLILADSFLEKLPTKNIGTGMFAIGGSKVRPRIGIDGPLDQPGIQPQGKDGHLHAAL